MENILSLPSSEYSVGWICALPVEMTAARAMLDNEHAKPNDQNPNDCNNYCLGRIGSYNIVIACLPAGVYGVTSAAEVGTQMLQTFQSLKFGLMVGIGGGAPSDEFDIRLGDVVVSKPGGNSGGVIQFDFGKEYGNGLFKRVGSLNQPPKTLLTALAFLETEHMIKGNRIPELLKSAYDQFPNLIPKFSHQGQDSDLLFEAEYDHNGSESSCAKCDPLKLASRQVRKDTTPVVHQGLIASGNQVMKHGATRERLRKELGVICFEMEAAGLMNILPCLVIRGICDYADSHKNKRWQPYAAMTAAAFASELLQILPTHGRELTDRTVEIVRQTDLWESSLELSLGSAEPAQVLSMFNVVAREIHIPTRPISNDDPKLDWVLKNIDYQQWSKPQTRLSILCLSGSDRDNLSKIESCIRDTDGSEIAHGIVLSLSWTDVFNAISPVKSFIETVFSVLLEKLPVKEARAALLRFLRTILEKLTAGDRKKLSEQQYDAKSKESFKQVVRTMLNLDSANLCHGLMAALMHQDKSFLITITSNKTWDNSQISFVRTISEEMRDFGEAASRFKLLFTGITNTALQDEWTALQHIQYDQERQECLSALFFDNTRYNKIIDNYPDSLEWLWTHSEYCQWAATNGSRLLYLEGKPGSGKSTLTKYFRVHMSDKVEFQDRPIIADFFYSHRDGERETRHRNMLQSLLWNILSQDSGFFHHFQGKYRQSRARSTQTTVDWNYESLQHIFRSIADHQRPKEIYLILDALDESEDCDRRDVVRFLLSLCSRPGPCVFKIFMASRPTTDIRLDVCGLANFSFIRIQDETQADIKRFAGSFLGPELNFTGKLLQEATDYVANTAQGVFLWVQLIRCELRQCVEKGYRKKEIFKKLLDLPTELESFYLHMMDNLDTRTEQDVADARSMFTLVLFAERSLTVTEIQHILALEAILGEDLDITEESFEDELIQGMETRIIHCGGNFLEIKGDKSVQLIHQTAREFFLPEQIPHQKPGPIARSRLIFDKEEDVHTGIASACIHYLHIIAHSDQTSPVQSWATETFAHYAERINSRPLLTYILSFLPYHIAMSSKAPEIESLLVKLTLAFHDKAISYLLATWFDHKLHQKLPTLRQISGMADFKLRLLHAAARKGLVETAEIVLLADTHIHGVIDGKSALHVAAVRGSEQITQLLLSQGADTASRSDLGRAPLHWAAQLGHLETVKVLLTQCDIDAQDASGLTALHLAAKAGHLAIVQLLVNQGAKLNIIDDIEHWSAIHWASFSGHIPIVQFLLDTCNTAMSESYQKYPFGDLGSSDSGESGGKTVVYIPLEGNTPGRQKILDDCNKLLTKARLEFCSPSSGSVPLWKGPNVIRVPAERYRPHELNLLLEKCNSWFSKERLCYLKFYSPNVEARPLPSLESEDRKGRTPIHIAAANNQAEAVKFLLDCGVDPSHRDKNSFTALIAATVAGHERVVQVLVDWRRELCHERDDTGRTALSHSALLGKIAVLRILSASQDSLDMRNNYGQTALHLATTANQVPAIRLLITVGSNVDSQDPWGATPLHISAYRGNLDTLKTLIDLGASPRAVDVDGRDALYLAAGKGHTAIVKALLEHRETNANSMDWRGWTALFWAAGNGYEQIVELLVEHGADVNARDKNSVTSLHLAARKGQLSSAQLLMTHGANPDARDSNGLNARHWAEEYNQPDLAQLLLAHQRGKSHNNQMDHDFSLKLWAREHGYDESFIEI